MIKKDKLKKLNEKLVEMVKAEKEKVAGYNQIAKLHSAYIAILLDKLGGTEDNPILIENIDVTNALEETEVRGYPPYEGAWCLYYAKKK